MKKFNIYLNDSSAVYFPGQSIQGVVQFYVDSKINTTGVHIEFCGVTYVDFKEKQRNGQGESCYSSLENHCHNTVALASKDGSEFFLSTGPYQYLFTTQLPEELPTSFECDGGYTRYNLRAYIACSSQDEMSCILPVTVLTVFDLNESIYAMRSEEVDDLQLVGCCSKKCVKTKLKLTKSGYVPGERIQLDASCDNQTQKSLDQAYVNLFMNITLKTEKKDLVVQKIIRSWSVPEIPPQTHLSLDDLQLTVPPLPSSGSRYCNNIDIHYTLQFTVELSNDVCCTSSLSLIVGNVPLESCANQYTGNEGANVAKVNNQQLPNEIQKRLLNSAGVPTHKYDNTSCVLVDTYFRSSDKDGEWHPEPLPAQPVKWRPSYLYYVNRISDT
eukprot:XP_011417330.1 PREDICTED: arrestin domain-containing protein 17 [Crassostrea gigas]